MSESMCWNRSRESSSHSAARPVRASDSLAAVRCGELVGRSPRSLGLFDEIRLLAGERCPVLVHGETGTGKELVARALHRLGAPQAPWVALNCAAIPEQLAASELFGHERGAFTGAANRHRGAFERADGGTLFLDEIGELSSTLQAQLLRVLETREYTRVGGDAPLRSEFRLVAATHRDLAEEVAAGRFRQDLYFRLGVAVLEVPPLRDRPEDLPLLARELLARDDRAAPVTLDEAALGALRRYSWPGNVRELANVLLRARLRASGGVIAAADLQLPAPPAVRPRSSSPDGGGWLRENRAAPWGMVRVDGKTLAEVERETILFSLQACGGSQAEAARRLGLPRQTLHDRLRRLGLVGAGGGELGGLVEAAP